MHTILESSAVAVDDGYGPVVQADRVNVGLGGIPVLRGLDLTVHPGEVVAVTGPNGSGKSTLLRLLGTLVRHSAGRLELFGVGGSARTSSAVRRRIGYIGHESAMHPDLTVRENLTLVARLASGDVDETDRVLAVVGLAGAADRLVRSCSQGMNRRAELARILLCQPELLLLDEPHAALDAASRVLVDRVTSDVAARGGAAVLVTHDSSAVVTLADRIMHLSQGQLAVIEATR